MSRLCHQQFLEVDLNSSTPHRPWHEIHKANPAIDADLDPNGHKPLDQIVSVSCNADLVTGTKQLGNHGLRFEFNAQDRNKVVARPQRPDLLPSSIELQVSLVNVSQAVAGLSAQ